jgi:nucleoside phosphorylase
MTKVDINQFYDKIDFGIITIREDEFLAVLDRFDKTYEVSQERRYIISEFKANNGEIYYIAIVRCVEQGPSESQKVAQTLIQDLNPDWLLLIGIGGGIPNDDFTLGDVILASRLHDFCVEAAFDHKRSEFSDQGGPMHPKVQDLLGILPGYNKEIGEWHSKIGLDYPKVNTDDDKLYGDDEWKKKVKGSVEKRFGKEQVKFEPKYKISALASSNKLVKSSKVIKVWKNTARHIQVIEMELAGVYRAARTKNKEYPILSIRGISDIVGLIREDEWTTFACHAAAAFAFTLLKTGMVKESKMGTNRILFEDSEQISSQRNDDNILEVLNSIVNIISMIEKDGKIWDDQYNIYLRQIHMLGKTLYNTLDDILKLSSIDIEHRLKAREIKSKIESHVCSITAYVENHKKNKGAKEHVYHNINIVLNDLRDLILQTNQLKNQ